MVLTFDDSKASHYTVVRPLLKKYGFGATFFITEGFSFATNKEDYLTWDQIAELHRDGFEIGNHTSDHKGVSKADSRSSGAGRSHQRAVRPPWDSHAHLVCLSGQYHRPGGIAILEELGFRFARRGGAARISLRGRQRGRL